MDQYNSFDNDNFLTKICFGQFELAKLICFGQVSLYRPGLSNFAQLMPNVFHCIQIKYDHNYAICCYIKSHYNLVSKSDNLSLSFPYWLV